jgi:trehalose 6-phosphate phosphatase
MFRILADRHASVLAGFASSNVLLAFDYDGTLAPIAHRPALARMRAETRRLLTAVAIRYPVTVIAGRARDELAQHVRNVPVWHLAGNHGVEPWGQEAANLAQVKTWVACFERELAAYGGVVVEDKRYSLTVHYRHARNPLRVRAAINRTVRKLPGARSLGGAQAVSVVPREAPDKRDALERVRRLLVCDAAIYVGDDETDEPVFAAGNSHDLLAVSIGARRSSRARYCLESQREVDRFLRRLLTLRPLRSTPSL